MGKLVFWIIVIAVGLLVARIASRLAAHGYLREQERQARRPDARRAGTSELVRCAHCGIQLPAAEAVRRQGFNYCTLAHSMKGRR